MKPTIKKLLLILLVVPVIVIAVSALRYFDAERRLGNGINGLANQISDYKLVDKYCSNEEFMVTCHRGYYTTDSVSVSVDRINKQLINSGYIVKKFKNGYDGPQQTYLARNEAKGIVIIYKQMDRSSNPKYLEKHGDVQFYAYLSNDMPDSKFILVEI